MQLNASFINFFIRWDIGNWSDCSVSCGRGMQTRPVVCAQRVSSTSRIEVQPSKCPSPRPESSRTCMNKPCAEWKVGEWQKVCLYTFTNTCFKGILHVKCSIIESWLQAIWVWVFCFKGHDSLPYFVHLYNTRYLNCINMNISIVDFAFEKKWYLKWYSQCSSVCGKGERRRLVVCHSVDDRNVTDDQCEGLKPLDIQICDMGSCAQGWFHSPWSRKVSSSKDVALQMYSAQFAYWKICFKSNNTDSQCTFFNKMCSGHL